MVLLYHFKVNVIILGAYLCRSLGRKTLVVVLHSLVHILDQLVVSSESVAKFVDVGTESVNVVKITLLGTHEQIAVWMFRCKESYLEVFRYGLYLHPESSEHHLECSELKLILNRIAEGEEPPFLNFC